MAVGHCWTCVVVVTARGIGAESVRSVQIIVAPHGVSVLDGRCALEYESWLVVRKAIVRVRGSLTAFWVHTFAGIGDAVATAPAFWLKDRTLVAEGANVAGALAAHDGAVLVFRANIAARVQICIPGVGTTAPGPGCDVGRVASLVIVVGIVVAIVAALGGISDTSGCALER